MSSSTGGAKKREARERLAAERAAAAAAQRRKDRLVRGGIVALIVIVVVGIGAIVVLTRKTTVDPNAAKPAGVLANYGVPSGTASKPVVDLYEDFQCPICKHFEDTIGATVEEQVAKGNIKVVYHPLHFLDDNLGNDSSFRAANASGCAQDQGKFVEFHDTVYKNQPSKEGAGYTDAQLIEFGRTAGVPDMDTFTKCVQDQHFKGWVDAVAAQGQSAGITGTPTYLVDGKKIDFSNDDTSWKSTFLSAIGQG